MGKLSRTNQLLSGIRVLDIGTMIAGPVACTFMAELGAEVIKVEQPNGGDPIRKLPPIKDGEGLLWNLEGRNKKSVTIDLRQQSGQDLFKRLVKSADVVVENFRPGTLAKWNIAYDDLCKVNSNLIMLSVSGFGQTGPNAGRAGYDRMALAFSGIMNATGYPDRPPVRPGMSLADYSTATFGAFAVMVALYNRDVREMGGQWIDLGLYESVFRYTDTMVPAFDQMGITRERKGNFSPLAAPGDNFLTKDGKFVVMAVSGSDALFRSLCHAIGQPDMATNPNYTTHVSRSKHIDELNDVVAKWIAANTTEVVDAAFTEAGIPFAVLYSIEDIFQDAHIQHRENIVSVEHPQLGSVKMPGVAAKFPGLEPPELRAAPALGSSNEDIFEEFLGLSKDEMSRLRAEKVI